MTPPDPVEPQAKREESGPKHRTGLVTLLFTDMVGSTALKQQLGDRAGASFFDKHHRIVREILARFPQGQEIETAGDSFLILFGTPSDAVQFALLLQCRLRKLKEESAVAVWDRIGIHVGEVVIKEDQSSAKPKELYGIQIDTCSRVMSLAQAGQVLMTRSAFDSARQVLKGEDIAGFQELNPEQKIAPLVWLNHGRYLLKGLEEPVEICEVREASQAAFSPPTSSDKAQRQVRADEEQVLGWRPALGQLVPNTRWLLEKKLGEGGFGEVWLGRHQTMKERRVFKFCFRADRVRSLKREMTLFRLIKERIGDHPNIVAIRDVYFDEPPFYVVMDHVEGSDLKGWCEQQGGVQQAPLALRLEIVAQITDALQAAHDAGVIHRDVKPGNILVASDVSRWADISNAIRAAESQPTDSRPQLRVQAKLTDFGIGQVVSEEALKGVTKAGFTQTILADSPSSQTGSQMYMAPELLAGKPASTRSDIYSLGVVLYQLLVGDLTRPLTTDWADHIADTLLRDDLKHCFAGNPQDRFPGAGQLAKQLRHLRERRAELERQRAELAARERAAYRRGIVRTASLAAVIIALVTGLAVVALHQSRKAKATALRESHERERAGKGEAEARRLLYVAKMNLAQMAWEQNNIARLRQLLEETQESPDRGFEWYYWQRQTHLASRTLRGIFEGVSSVSFSPDGQRIVTGSWDQTAKVWEMASGRELLALKGPMVGVSKVAFSPDGQRIVTGGLGNKIAKVWEAASGRELYTLKGHSASIGSVAFSPDGQKIVTGSFDHTAKVWDAASSRELVTLEGHRAGIQSAAFSPDGQRIVTGSADKTARVWDAVTGRELLKIEGHSDDIISVAFSPDGQRILTGSWDRIAKVWEAASGRELLTLNGHSSRIECVAFSRDGQRIVTASNDQTAKVWDAASGGELLTLKGHSSGLNFAAFSPDGQWIVTGSEDQTAKVWEATIGREPLTLKRHNAWIGSVAFSPDGQRILTGSGDLTAKLWDAGGGPEILTLNGHTAQIRSVAFSPDGRRIVTGSADQTAKVWAAAGSGVELATLKGHTAWIGSVAFSPDGQRIVTGSGDQTAKVWNPAGGPALLTLKGHKGQIRSVAFSPDGQRIVTGSWDQTAKVWDAVGGRLPLTLKGHSAEINSVAFSPDGQRIVTGSEDQTAKVWKAVSGEFLFPLNGHSAGINSVAFSPDGQRLVTGSADHTAKVWDAASGRELLTLKGHSAGINSAAISPDGQRIVTGSDDQTAKVWRTAQAGQVIAWREEERAGEQRLIVLQRERTAEQERQRIARSGDESAIKRWLILAPIALANNQSTEDGLDAQQIEGEARLRPKAGERTVMGSGELQWQEVALEDYLIDFNVILGRETSQSVAYAVSYIRSEAEQRGLQMLVASDDEAKVYLNAKQIHNYPFPHSFVADQDTVPGIVLNAGLNVLVFKVVNGNRDWQGSIRFTDAQGNQVKGIKVTLTP